jgi:hypothetical protein
MNQRYRDDPRWPAESQASRPLEEDVTLTPPDITSKVTGTMVEHKVIQKPGGRTVCVICGRQWPCGFIDGVAGVVE